MANKSKQKGTAWETQIVNYLTDSGFPARRKVLSGRLDQGDIELLNVPDVIIEAKNSARYELSEWVKEAETEAANSGKLIGVVWVHRKGKSSPGDGYVVVSGKTFRIILDSLRQLYNAILEK